MGKFDGVLLVSDFDDTIYSDGRVAQRNLDALDYFLSQGGRFTVATGRAYTTFAPYAHLIPMNAPAILSNGSALYDFQEDRMTLQTCLPSSAAWELEEVCDAFPELGVEVYRDEDIFAFRPNHVTDAHMEKVKASYTPVDSLALAPRPWTKAIFQQDWEKLYPVQEWFLSRYGEKYEAIFSNQVYLEITRKGSTKGSFVEMLAKKLDISPENLYCVGDNQNDLSMLERSAIPFAPANCAQSVKDWGAKILCSCEEGVLGDIIDILDEIY